MFFQDQHQKAFSLVAGQSQWREDSSIVLQILFSKCANYVFSWLLNRLKKEQIEQLFYKCYFSNVQMTFSLLVAGQGE